MDRLKSSLFIHFKLYNNDKGFDRLSTVQSKVIFPRHSRTLLKVSGQIASGVRHFSKRISQTLWELRVTEKVESRQQAMRILRAATKDAILSDALGWHNEVSSLSNRTNRYRLRQHLHKRIAWQMYDRAVQSAVRDFVHPETSSSVRFARMKMCEKHNVPAGAVRAKRIPRDKVASRGNRFLSRKTLRYSGLAGKCSFRDIDADRNNFVGDSDFSNAPGFAASRSVARLRPFYKLQRYFRERVSPAFKIIDLYRVREIAAKIR